MLENRKDLSEAYEENWDNIMTGDFYRLYREELKLIRPLEEQELASVLDAVSGGDKAAGKRLSEAYLSEAAELAERYIDRGLPIGDLVQEANVALLLAVEEYKGGDFRQQMEEKIREAIQGALDLCSAELRLEEEMAARVNVLNDISSGMARELGREATVEELADRMKMTPEEIKDIMKLTLDALSVSGE